MVSIGETAARDEQQEVRSTEPSRLSPFRGGPGPAAHGLALRHESERVGADRRECREGRRAVV